MSPTWEPGPAGGALLALLVVLAGCLGGVPSSGDGDGSGPEGLVPQGGGSACDEPLVPGVYAREPDLAADPSDPDRMAVGMMVEVPSAASLAGVDEPIWSGLARTDDGGETWDYATLGGWPGDPDAAGRPFAGSVVVGDPVVEFLPDGTLVYLGLMIRADGSTTLFAARYPDDAMEPSEVAVVARGALPVPQGSAVPTPYQVAYNDKPYLAVDPATGDLHAAWSWRSNVQGSSRAVPVAARSTDGGRTWSVPQLLVDADAAYTAGDAFHIGAYPVVGVDGTVHVLWWEAEQGVLYHARSDDRGRTFAAPERLAPAGGSFGTTGDNVLAAGLPQVAVDRSPGPRNGSIHVGWTGQRAEGEDWDVQVVTSRDDGRTWSDPVRVHPPSLDDGTHQLVPAVDVGPDGALSVIYYDETGPSSGSYHAYLTRSLDGGGTFETLRMTREPTDPAAAADQQPLGDYIGLGHDDRGPVAVWQDGRDGDPDDPYSEVYVCELAPAGAG